MTDNTEARLEAAVRADALAQYDTHNDRVTAVLAAADKFDASSGVHRITEEDIFQTLWARRFPTGGQDAWITLDANAARAIAKAVTSDEAGTR